MDIQEYIGKKILAWLWYNESYSGEANTRCYIRPQILIHGDSCELIDSKDFPTRGGIEIHIKGGDNAEELFERVGSLVEVKINAQPSTNDFAYNYYNLMYSYQHGRDISQIWIESFSGKNFYQIIDIEYDFSVVQTERTISGYGAKLYTRLILLRYEGEYYGPFEHDSKEKIVYLNGCKEYQYMVGVYDAIEYNDDLLEIEDQNDQEAVLLLPQILPSPDKCKKNYDWISEEKLIDSFIKVLCRAEDINTRGQIRQLKNSIPQMLKDDSGVDFSDERIERICNLIEKVFAEEENIRRIIHYILNDISLKEILIEEIANNYFERIKTKISEHVVVQRQIEELEERKTQMEDKIKILEASSNKVKGIPLDYQERIDNLQKENENLHQNVNALQVTLDQIGDTEKKIIQLQKEHEEYEKKRKKAAEDYDSQLLRNKDLEKRFQETIENFSDEAKVIAQILDSKLLDRVLRSIDGEIDDESSSKFDVSLLHVDSLNWSDIIERVTNYIREKAHRDVTTNDVANYLICISQGFITTFAGEPGTGKTSICNILAKALGLVADAPQRRFIEISVERGWSSHKDFIGYYNPLTKTMEKSNVEVFNAFVQMDRENECEQSNIAPFIILLDEANLSPMEHYWAAFLKNCDFSSVSNRSIMLGGNSSFRLPEHLRFLATVNFDHTTEELSPRFLDRSWVIMLEPTGIEDEDEDIDNAEDMISFEAMKAAFCVGKDDVIDEVIQDKWNAIQKIFRDSSLQIMPRNLKMVKNYCAVACRCMEHDTPATKFAPLDYAFSQKILPTINGTGENYSRLIEELMKECTPQNMPISAKHLERMKRVSENNMGFFQFFAR